jgi:hypothetical protein
VDNQPLVEDILFVFIGFINQKLIFPSRYLKFPYDAKNESSRDCWMDSIIKVKEGWIETAQREISFKNFMTADITTPKQCFCD